MVPTGVKVHFSFPSGDDQAPVELESLGYNPEQEPVDRTKGYGGYHWLQTTSGTGLITIGPRTLTVGPDQGILLPPNLPHSYIAATWPWSTRYLTFRGPLAEMLVSSFGQATSTPFTWDADSPFAGFMEHLTDGLRAGEWETIRGRSTRVYQFLGLLADCGRPLDLNPLSVSDVNDRLATLYEYIDQKLDDPALGVDDLAQFLDLSPRHLNELFTRAGQASPYQYLKARRLSRARQLLVCHRDLGIKEISYRVGFRDPSHFIHAFRQSQGKTPEQYRRCQLEVV